MSSVAFRISAVLGFLGVALGAFGAHGLKDVLARHGTLEIWQTAVLYHLVHAVVMLGVASSSTAWRKSAWICFLAGVLIFSGSLYIMALTNVRRLGMITPLGGVGFLAGWALLAIQGLRGGNAIPGDGAAQSR